MLKCQLLTAHQTTKLITRNPQKHVFEIRECVDHCQVEILNMAEDGGYLDLVDDWWTCTAEDIPIRPVEHNWNFKPAKQLDPAAITPKIVVPGLIAGGAAAAGRIVGPMVNGLSRWFSMSKLHV